MNGRGDEINLIHFGYTNNTTLVIRITCFFSLTIFQTRFNYEKEEDMIIRKKHGARHVGDNSCDANGTVQFISR